MSAKRPYDIELLLSRVLSPVEPPEKLRAPLHERLEKWTEDAVDELESWELSAMRDPRNWGRIARPVAAVAIAGTAGTALVLMRAHNQSKLSKSQDPFEAAEKTLRAVADETRKLLRR
ncbi:MAG TPA: hypothetical protein VNT22_06650 [Baekduia sp.]|nr:hypothetical protein [Baekduia sp.]